MQSSAARRSWRASFRRFRSTARVSPWFALRASESMSRHDTWLPNLRYEPPLQHLPPEVFMAQQTTFAPCSLPHRRRDRVHGLSRPLREVQLPPRCSRRRPCAFLVPHAARGRTSWAIYSFLPLSGSLGRRCVSCVQPARTPSDDARAPVRGRRVFSMMRGLMRGRLSLAQRGDVPPPSRPAGHPRRAFRTAQHLSRQHIGEFLVT